MQTTYSSAVCSSSYMIGNTHLEQMFAHLSCLDHGLQLGVPVRADWSEAGIVTLHKHMTRTVAENLSIRNSKWAYYHI